ncbi:uncharacterized protein PHACADRAFT_202042 [Phanerochaete carnosa HHB-10118-sp]|uniref:Pentacotripeptide-repeat region of PRORP domain-containing protein n=1 Tax=Phanerochaete carnosa (strain HHB-10118-sp) TaxID=650164 RepID=K5VD66_PHACS|nr:uncharacterized protein PHACADRAFT_202042 [Phanerochaete carnosa HHB-10118-sp]EKM49078.1 hypothetical protein PHACADRAFT_202042 [Phanerochaete carnosa HHB-10118-sp]
MKKREPKPDVASFNVFMKFYSRSKNLRGISSIMREMDVLGMHGDIYTASVLLPALYSARTDALQLILALLRQNGVTVDTDTCTTLLTHLVRSEDDTAFEAVVAIIEYMEAHMPELAPTSKTFGAVLCGIERRVWSKPSLAAYYQHLVITKMNKHQPRKLPRFKLQIMHVIQACCENPTPEGMRRAMAYYRMHRRANSEKGRAVNWQIWGKLMAHLIRSGEWELADELARDRADVDQLSPGMLHLLEQARTRSSDISYLTDD